MPFFRKTNYQKSNSILVVDFYVSNLAKQLSVHLLSSKETEDRQQLGTKFLEELEQLADIPKSKLKISDAKQYHKKYKGKVAFKQYGYYDPNRQYIYINNRTAVRGQYLAPKTFLDTLLHEWLHHYDSKKLKLNSIHTSGFYARLKDLKEKVGYWHKA